MGETLTDRAQTSAGAFKCYRRSSFFEHQRRILYVGKATSGSFGEEDACEQSFNGKRAFWTFARRVSGLADDKCQDLSNLAWSNIFKQGVVTGNPVGAVAEAQRHSAAKELRAEVEALKPSLIVLVNAGYYEEIPKAAYLIDDGGIGERALTRTQVDGEEKWDLWSRAAYPPYPPIVWMYHPQGKRREYTDAALTLIRSVMGWATKKLVKPLKS